jgi:hypothetical protein
MIGEALNIATKRAMAVGSIEGITLPDEVGQQLIIQYVDDMNYTIRETEHNLVNLISLLNLFHLTSGLEINWGKSVAYWLATTPPPNWLQWIRCQWAVEHQLSKLLSTPFGIDLHIGDVDEFLLTKVQKKLTYWTSVHLSLIGRALIVNSVLLSSLWFFIVTWVGSLAILWRIRGMLYNFLWSGTDHRCRARVSCSARRIGGLDLIDPDDSLMACECKLTTGWRQGFNF